MTPREEAQFVLRTLIDSSAVDPLVLVHQAWTRLGSNPIKTESLRLAGEMCLAMRGGKCPGPRSTGEPR